MRLALALLLSLTACAPTSARDAALPALPVPVANNAVAVLQADDGPNLFSFLGLGAGKTWRDTKTAAWTLAPEVMEWTPLPDAPGPGRLAATAIAANGKIFLFGGYTVAEDGSEKSIETVHAFDPESGAYEPWPAMPVPVDDAVSAVYADRYLYLVSGWHDTGNVNLVQVLDVRTRRWFQATPWPGAPVFGHAGGIAGNVLLICGGVKVVTTTGKRRFAAASACYRGDIDADNPAKIDWTVAPHHPGPGLYRAAAVGDGTRVIFAGGSDNPYNYNGIGYDGEPSPAMSSVYVYGVESRAWQTAKPLADASMDHRGLLPLGNGRFAIVGGMRDPQTVSAEVQVWASE